MTPIIKITNHYLERGKNALNRHLQKCEDRPGGDFLCKSTSYVLLPKWSEPRKLGELPVISNLPPIDRPIHGRRRNSHTSFNSNSTPLVAFGVGEDRISSRRRAITAQSSWDSAFQRCGRVPPRERPKSGCFFSTWSCSIATSDFCIALGQPDRPGKNFGVGPEHHLARGGNRSAQLFVPLVERQGLFRCLSVPVPGIG